MKVLIVDDEDNIRNVVKEYCEAENYEVLEATDGYQALKKIENNKIDILVLDIMMPKMDGYTLLKEIPKNKKVPTIVLSARSEEYDKLQGFDLGIDDYLTKPFSPRELIARIKAISNRTTKSNKIYKYQTLEIDYLSHTVRIDNKLINLTPKEFDVQTYLVDNKEISISREQLLEKVWGYDFFGDDRTIDTHIKTLRNNLGKYRKNIITVRSIGYKFTENEEEYSK